MTTIAKLTVDLIAESSSFRKELDKATATTKNWSEKVSASVGTAATAIAGLGVTAATGLAALYTVTAQGIDQQTKFADRIGITTEALAGLQHAGELTGVSADRMQDSLQGMVERISEAKEGTGEAAEALERLGLSAQALNQLAPEEQFMVIADAMQQLENRSDQVRTAIQLFEGEGAALLNTLDAGSEGIAAMMREAELLGVALDRVDAAQVEQANDAFYRAGLASQGFARQLTAELAPIVEGVSNEFLKATINAGGMGEVATKAADAIVTGLDVVYTGLLSLQNGWNVVKLGAISAARFGVEALYALEYNIKAFLNSLPGVEMEMSESLSRAVVKLRDESKEALDDVITTSNKLATQMVAVFDGGGAVKQITDQWKATSQATAKATAETKTYGNTLQELGVIAVEAGETSKSGTKTAESAWNNYLTRIGNTSANLEQAATGWTTSFGDALADMVTKGEMDFARLADSIINDLLRIAIQSQIVAPIANSLGLFGNGTGGTGGTGGAAVAGTRAAGGPVNAGSTYLVGERGPELFTAGTAGRVTASDKLGGNVIVNVYNSNASEYDVSTRSSTSADGMKQLDIYIEQKIRSTVNGDIARGQGVSTAIQQQFGLTRKGY
ncbi:hypothetical protein GCM10023116_46790 [Kistimonas scapharcae]|uniref:Bacteriophage tail tape measure C-terminal domain-containing protein n=1 Tax=Kistimonas scapharcae TaxID=1036133 RepID=A0ABP8V8R8_9GAMM